MSGPATKSRRRSGAAMSPVLPLGGAVLAVINAGLILWIASRSSMFMAADVRPSGRSSPALAKRVKYSKGNDTPGSCLTGDHRWSACLPRL